MIDDKQAENNREYELMMSTMSIVHSVSRLEMHLDEMKVYLILRNSKDYFTCDDDMKGWSYFTFRLLRDVCEENQDVVEGTINSLVSRGLIEICEDILNYDSKVGVIFYYKITKDLAAGLGGAK